MGIVLGLNVFLKNFELNLMWMLIFFIVVDEDVEKVLFCDLEDFGEDIRRCIFCWYYGDFDFNVRVFIKYWKYLFLVVNDNLLNGRYFFILDILIELEVYVWVN